MTEAETQRLIADLRQRRGTGDSLIVVEPAPAATPITPAVLDQFARRHGLYPIADGWQELTRGGAVSLATAVLARDMAYDVRLMSDPEALELTERFVTTFSDSARFFTNNNRGMPGDASRGWTPLTESTFDVGILGVDEHLIGVLVVQDED